MASNVKEKVYSIVIDQLGLKEDVLQENKTLDDLGADSVDRVEIIMKLEEEFNKEISDNEAEKLNTLEDFIEYLSK